MRSSPLYLLPAAISLTLLLDASRAIAGDLPDLPYDSGSTGADGALVFRGGPSARCYHAMAYDAARQRTVLFGGNTGSASAETWEYDGSRWARVTTSTSPSARYYHAMVYDTARQRTVLFGGTAGSDSAETWEYNGSNWARVITVTSPAARHCHAMAYDAARQRTVLFGGVAGSYNAETWEYDGGNWARVTTATSPSARHFHAMAYDATRRRTVLFGGGTDTVNAETWEYDGSNWARVTTATSPAARYMHALVYDAARQRAVLWGASSDSGTWEYDGSSWARAATATSPAARSSHAMVYDAARQRAVLFGGTTGTYNAETWEYDGDAWVYIAGGDKVFDMTGRADGTWHFTSIDIGPNVTMTFRRNTANTPVVWLASGNVRIDGVLDLRGGDCSNLFAPGYEVLGGPGGFAGGLGGIAFNVSGSYTGTAGQGPGGGSPGTASGQYGGHASYATSGSSAGVAPPGAMYGNTYIQPLVGGSGGGGQASTATANGANGGGGGGAILICSSRDIELAGTIRADGGYGGVSSQIDAAGSGGAIRLVADRFMGSGSLSAVSQVNGGGNGRIRVEAYYRMFTGTTTPTASLSAPIATQAFSNTGALRIIRVAGANVTNPPTGQTVSPDVVFAAAGEVTVTVQAQGVPDGTPVTLRIIHTAGLITAPTGTPVTLLNGTADIPVTVPAGHGTIQAFAQFTTTAQ